MDEIDRASDREQDDRARAISAASVVVKPVLTGACHWCQSDTTDRFCCVECRDDWQRSHAAKVRNGL